jgi:hypothetical protein
LSFVFGVAAMVVIFSGGLVHWLEGREVHDLDRRIRRVVSMTERRI